MFNFSIRPNIFLGVAEGSAQYKKWYFELIIDQVDPFLTAEPTHLRVGWASSSGYAPYPGGGEGWGGNGVGDDLYSYGFDGLHLWSGKHLAGALGPDCSNGNGHFMLKWYRLKSQLSRWLRGKSITSEMSLPCFFCRCDFMYLLTVLGLRCCTGFSPAVGQVGASHADGLSSADHRLSGAWASVV